jgi:hypothetical protein
LCAAFALFAAVASMVGEALGARSLSVNSVSFLPR